MSVLLLRIVRVLLFLVFFYFVHGGLISFLKKKMGKEFSLYDMEVLAPAIIISYLLSMILFLPIKLFLA